MDEGRETERGERDKTAELGGEYEGKEGSEGEWGRDRERFVEGL